jgi:hypothetical protein
VISPQYWWERRREGERTAAYLARVLDQLGEPYAAVAAAARALHFDDYFCPDEIDDGMNIHRLVAAIACVKPADAALKRGATQVALAAKEGEFDGTREESREWGRSPQGRAAFTELIKPKPPR